MFANVKVAISPVTTLRFERPFWLACASMYCFCVLEFEKAVILEFGKISAR